MPTPDVTAGEIMLTSAALLNDSAQQVYTNAVQIPYLKIALRELREYFELDNIPVTTKSSSIITLAAGITELGFATTPALPTDLIEIIQLWESTTGTNNFTPMERKNLIPHYLNGVEYFSFNIWAWEGNIIHLLPCVQSNDLKIDYIKQLPNIVDQNSTIGIINGQSFLEYRTAALLAQFIGQNETRANELNANAGNAIERILGIENKAKQAIMTRRLPFRANWKRRGLW
jgi:hypothetical protein